MAIVNIDREVDLNLSVDEMVEQYNELDSDDQQSFRSSLSLKDTDKDEDKSWYNTLEEAWKMVDRKDENKFLEMFELKRLSDDEDDEEDTEEVPEILKKLRDEFTEDQLEKLYEAGKKTMKNL